MLAGVNVTDIVSKMLLCSLACMHRRFLRLTYLLGIHCFLVDFFDTDKRGNSFVCNFGAT
jgi:hypothetical protein